MDGLHTPGTRRHTPYFEFGFSRQQLLYSASLSQVELGSRGAAADHGEEKVSNSDLSAPLELFRQLRLLDMSPVSLRIDSGVG